MNRIKIAGIVVTYNIDKEKLIKNINSYINYIDLLIIVDNSDIDTQLKDIYVNNAKIKYISMEGNEGIAKALNCGIEYAINQSFKYVLTMDQDSSLRNNLIEEYMKWLRNDVIIYSPNYIIERKKTKKYKAETNELYWTMTSGNLLNLELYKKVGKFREDFFIDAVDYEYCLRARKRGYKILQCNKAELIHNPGIQKIKKILFFDYKYGYMSPTRMYYQIRNLKSVSEEYKSYRAKIIMIIKFLKIILLFDNKEEFIKMYKKGKKDCINGKFGKLQE